MPKGRASSGPIGKLDGELGASCVTELKASGNCSIRTSRMSSSSITSLDLLSKSGLSLQTILPLEVSRFVII